MGMLITKRFSLDGIGDGYTSDHYVVYQVPPYADFKEFSNFDQDTITEDEALERIISFIKGHFISGVGLDINEAGESVATPMIKDDVALLPLITIRTMFTVMKGGTLDPKVSPAEVQSEQPQAQEQAPTQTT